VPQKLTENQAIEKLILMVPEQEEEVMNSE